MPDALIEWNEENLQSVISSLYQEAETDEDLRSRLLTEPFEVLSGRISIPEDYRGGVFAREKNLKTLMLYLPASTSAREALQPRTTSAEQTANFEVICTYPTQW